MARNRKKTTAIPKKKKKDLACKAEGIVTLNRDGLGFVKCPDLEDDVFIRTGKLRGALSGDKVKIGVYNKRRPGNGKQEGEVIAILKRSEKPHVGTLIVRGNKVWTIVESRNMPYDIRVQVASPDELPTIGGVKASDGMKVATLVTEWPKGVPEPLGMIVDVLGKPGENDTEMHAILAEYNLPYRFEPEVENAADKISEVISDKEIARRKDYRGVPTLTIDPADAKDFDDAVSYRKLDNGNAEVGIHIADVTHYVIPGDIVDREAEARGTSVYLVDRTIPMLPEKLCNKLCSLRPHEDKLCFSAIFELDSKARVKNSWFGRTVINSDYRFDYAQAQDVIETQKGPMATEILNLHELASLLRKERFAKGAISFERPEIKVLVDKSGKPVDVIKKESVEANFLIEEFMLLANRSVAEFVARKCKAKEPTFVYRIHDNPSSPKLEELRKFARNFNRTLGATDSPKKIAGSLNALMSEVKDTPEENAIQMLALRCMARACYSTDNIGHYGLAFKYYCHFTSPIRRYPDMMVHRLLAHYLAEGSSLDKHYYEERCQHASEREQLATEAERSSIKYKIVEFMRDKVGQEFDGIISGLTEWGIYVEVGDNGGIEGMVSLREIANDYFEFDADKYQTRSHATGKVYTLGDKVRVRVLRANLEQKLLDFELILQEQA